MICKDKLDELLSALQPFYGSEFRQMPWRENTSEYYIFVSEVMLQQTQVSRVKDKFTEFVRVFPGFESLAGASLSEMYPLWQGLGYNRRAKWLRDSAKIIAETHNGMLPRSKEALDDLPGIGPNTAAAILVYAFNLPEIFIETNIRTVIIHHFFKDDLKIEDNAIVDIMNEIIDTENPRGWYWALMDYGSSLKHQFGNLSRKSSTYRTQSAFTGSKRKVRGEILRLLSLQKHASAESISAEIQPGTAHACEPILQQLEREGIIREENGIYRITD